VVERERIMWRECRTYSWRQMVSLDELADNTNYLRIRFLSILVLFQWAHAI